MNQQPVVFVGLSGGVDSSVAAARLLRAGYTVVGVFIKVWHPDFLECNWEAERLDAMRVAAKLGIRFMTCDAEAAYRDEVAAYFIDSYRQGITPNPDVMCNRAVKFGVFYDFAKRHGADFIATGHYAEIRQTGDQYGLYRGQDQNKDQSYFLWNIPRDILPNVLLPVGDTDKATIRTEAEALGLITAKKRDSQGICFLGHVDIPEFLSHYIDLVPGQVLDQAGQVIGTHEGAFVYTLGQRHSFTLQVKSGETAPHYVIAKDIEKNTITVGTTPPVIEAGTALTLTHVNLLGTVTPGSEYEVQLRYRQTPIPVTVDTITDTTLTLTMRGESDAAASGQSCVLYRGDECLGGGILL